MLSNKIVTAGVLGLAALGLVNAGPIASDQDKALELINKARADIGQPALIWDAGLKEDAYNYSSIIAKDEILKHAPASDRKGAGELLSMFRDNTPYGIQMANPLRESVKNWLNKENKQYGGHPSNYLGLCEQLLSPKATRIGCASFGMEVLNNNVEVYWVIINVCRVFADIKPEETKAVSDETKAVLQRRQTFTGDFTYYAPGLGACGWHNNNGDKVVALSQFKMGPQSNGNPMCGKMIRATSPAGKSIDLKVVDKCMGCAENDIDVDPASFTELIGSLDIGRANGVKWYFL